VDEYGTLTNREVSADVTGAIAGWLRTVFVPR
jgi:hypothetical protein